MSTNKALSAPQANALLAILQKRFDENQHRHKGMVWNEIKQKLLSDPRKLRSLHAMEETGGEPDVVGYDSVSDVYLFYDCAPESPKGRRSLCYDRQALDARKEHKPQSSAMEVAASIGISLLTEQEYRGLQQLGAFDTKTSSWIQTPNDIRSRGGALFCDRRYDTVFCYHNGAESYYGSRAFRGVLKV